MPVVRQVKIRESNVELIRILAMFFIVGVHCMVHGDLDYSAANPISINLLWAQFVGMWGSVGTDMFVLITGYFLSKSFAKVSGFFKLWLTIFFYSAGFLVVFFLAAPERVTFGSIATSLLPVMRNHYWFLTCYVLLYAVSPFLGAGVRALTKRQHEWLMGLVLLLWSLIPTSHVGSMYYNEFLLYVMLFIVASYVRIYEIRKLVQVRWLVLTLVAVAVVSFASIVVTEYLHRLPIFSMLSDKVVWRVWIGRNSPLTILMALSIFLLLLKLELGQIKWINAISGCMLGVYLIHENIFVRPYLWGTLLKVKEHFESGLSFVPWSIAAIVGVFVACIGIELLRKKLFGFFVDVPVAYFRCFDSKISALFQRPAIENEKKR